MPAASELNLPRLADLAGLQPIPAKQHYYRTGTLRWSDSDPDRAAIALADLALRLRHAELLARIKGREPTQHALAIAFGTGEEGAAVMEAFGISDAERSEVGVLTRKLTRILEDSGAERRLLLAALAEAGTASPSSP
jgi:hypothetical protein